MVKKCVLIASAGILAIGVSAFAMNKSENQGKFVVEGKVTGIRGNVVTIRDSKGGEMAFELRSVAGLKVGATATCEEDCGRTLKVGGAAVIVQKVLKQKASGDPHVDQKVVR